MIGEFFRDASLQIRGRTLRLDELVNRKLFDPKYLDTLGATLQPAQPFPHLVDHDWFNPLLLELVQEEFDLLGRDSMNSLSSSHHEATYRSAQSAYVTPAIFTYFSLLHSKWFIEILTQISGVKHLMADTTLFGGGLHETRANGRFDIHRDFDRHPGTGLRNEFVLITYLNHDWKTEHGGALELWDQDASRCIASVAPEFGKVLILKHSERSYHGHPTPFTGPKPRRSLASYYYTNPEALFVRAPKHGSTYLAPNAYDMLRTIAKRVTPPIVWDAITKSRRQT